VLAEEIERTVHAGTLIHVLVEGSWTERPVRYGDCAILIQSRTKLKEYEAALLSQGVPFRVIGGIGFFEEDEVQAILAVLFSLWNPTTGWRLPLRSSRRSSAWRTGTLSISCGRAKASAKGSGSPGRRSRRRSAAGGTSPALRRSPTSSTASSATPAPTSGSADGRHRPSSIWTSCSTRPGSSTAAAIPRCRTSSNG